ncbi:hypothetical protein ACOSQ2_028578 [Xanthoceras sorbifolium]
MMEETVDEVDRIQMQNQHEVPATLPVMRDYALPVIETSPSCILLDELSRNYELKNIHFNMLPFFHGDMAKQWLMTLPTGSLCTWSAVYKKFMGKFYSHQKTSEGESFHEAWDRYKLLLNHCPHHKYPLELQNQFFYDGLTLNC